MSKSFAKIRRNFILLTVFSIAMGALEGIVVIYLRQIYYPKGFDFPLVLFPPRMFFIEEIREASTILMLLCIGIIAGENFYERFSYFLYAFAVWDISYYAWLKIFLNWPPSLLTWDILFLIPVPWVGPVLAPIICSLTMILIAFSIVGLQQKGYTLTIRLSEYMLGIVGAFIIFLTFIWDYSKIIIEEGFRSNFLTLTKNEHLRQIISRYKLTHYNWYLFALGETLILCALALVVRRTKSSFHHY